MVSLRPPVSHGTTRTDDDDDDDDVDDDEHGVLAVVHYSVFHPGFSLGLKRQKRNCDQNSTNLLRGWSEFSKL